MVFQSAGREQLLLKVLIRPLTDQQQCLRPFDESNDFCDNKHGYQETETITMFAYIHSTKFVLRYSIHNCHISYLMNCKFDY